MLHHGELIVSHVDLIANELAVEVVPVRRVMGIYNMYADLGQATVKQRRHIEDMFENLEKEASGTFRRITEAFKQGDIGLWLPREERNILRKFLFLLHILNTALKSIQKDKLPGLNTWEAVEARDSERRVWMDKFVFRPGQ